MVNMFKRCDNCGMIKNKIFRCEKCGAIVGLCCYNFVKNMCSNCVIIEYNEKYKNKIETYA